MNNLFNQKLLIQKAQEEINLSDYFEKRKIHFYVNLCKFSIVEFFYPSHEEENILNDMMGNGYLFRFEKVMKK